MKQVDKQVKRTKDNPYLGHDIAEFMHQNKFHRSASEAYRDADYASWFENDPEMSDKKLFTLEFLCVLPFIVMLIYAVKCVIMYYK
jgi:hypothetical protein